MASASPVGNVVVVVKRTFVPDAKSFANVSSKPDDEDAVNVFVLMSVRELVPVTSVVARR